MSDHIEINREDEADALVSAALRLLSSDEELWSAPQVLKLPSRPKVGFLGLNKRFKLMKILLMVAIGGAIGAVARQQSNQFIMRIFGGSFLLVRSS